MDLPAELLLLHNNDSKFQITTFDMTARYCTCQSAFPPVYILVILLAQKMAHIIIIIMDVIPICCLDSGGNSCDVQIAAGILRLLRDPNFT